MVQSVATHKNIDEDALKPNAAYIESMKKDRQVQKELKGWRNAEVDFKDSFGQALTNQRTHDPNQKVQPPNMASGTNFD